MISFHHASQIWYPLSSVQREVWFDQALYPDVPLYNIGGYNRINGEIDPEIFLQALALLVQETDVLRMRLMEKDGVPLQSFPELSHLDLRFRDHSQEENPLEAAIASIQKSFARPFKILSESLFRTALHKVSEDCYLWEHIYHHLVADGWTISLITYRCAEIYKALLRGEAPSVRNGVAYLQFVESDEVYLNSSSFEKHGQYWREKFAPLPAPLLAPRARFTNQTDVIPGSLYTWSLPRNLYIRLEVMAQEHSVSVFHALLGLLYVLFTRVQDQDECVLGLPVLNRSTAAFKQCPGLFASVIPERFSFGREIDFVALMQAIAKTLRASYRCQRFPVSEIHRLAGVYGASRKRLNDISLSFEAQDHAARFGDNPPSDAVALNHGFEQTPLTVYVRAYSENKDVLVDFSYSLAYFDEDEMKVLHGRFMRLLEEVLDHPLCSIGELDILLPEERRKLLVEWSGADAVAQPASGDAIDAFVHQLFEAQALRGPDSTAVVFGDETISYAELNSRANKLAHVLIALGVAPDERVAIALERSPAMIVALLAVLKAGGAYVPLDPDYPQRRLAFMLEDSGAQILITQESLRERLPDTVQNILCVDTGWSGISRQPDGNPQRSISPEQLAYVIYTSGSTGTPKGVAIPHRGFGNLALAQIHAFGLKQESRVLQFASFSFDASASEVAMALCCGATLALPDAEQRMPGLPLLKYLSEVGITHSTLPPTALAALPQTTLSKLECMIVAGEACPPTLAAFWSKGRRFFNAYGPTEITVCATIAECRHEDIEPAISLPIGRPITNTQIYVLDRKLQPVPIGVIGEIHVGGVGLARGYLNRPELTAERFVDDPFSGVQGSRLYKTGDLARYRVDGSLEFIGRLDHQVKIRGFRVELGEIESALTAHPTVREAIVMIRRELSGDQRLVAYLEDSGGEKAQTRASAAELRIFLRAKLPEYMIPAVFVWLSKLPLTPNGKVDREALPEPEHTDTTQTDTAPRDSLEEILVGLSGTVLKKASVGIHDNFFELGGHSLLATHLVSRLRETLGRVIPVRWLFEAPTMAEFAVRIRTVLGDRNDGELEARRIQPASRDRSLPLSFAQQRLWFLDQLEGPSATYNMPGALELTGDLDIDALNFALTEIIRRHESLRTCLVVQKGEPVQVIQPCLPLEYHVVADGSNVGSALAARACPELVERGLTIDILSERLASTLPTSDPRAEGSRHRFCIPVINLRQFADPDVEAKRLAREEALRPFDLALDLPIRARLLQREDTAWTLLLTFHHSAADGWSIEIFLRELTALYRAFIAGEPSPLAALGIQYADYAVWQRGYLTGERLAHQLEIWRHRFSAAPECINFPTCRPRPTQQSYRGAALSFEIEGSLNAELKALSKLSGATLFMTLLATWTSLLGRYSADEDIIIGSPVANRTQSSIEPLIGFFVNTLPLRMDLSGNPSFLDFLARVRQICLEAYAHQEIPFESLVESLDVPRNLAHAPLFQFMFVFQNMAQDALVLPGLKATLKESEHRVSKYDLTLSLTEVEGALIATLEYATDLFDASMMERLGGHFVRLLRSVVAAPERAIGELEMLAPEEKSLLLVEWNSGVGRSIPRAPGLDVHTRQGALGIKRPTSEEETPSCVHQLFEAQVIRTPEAMAVSFEDQVLSYAELNARANHLAHRLIEMGVVADERVGISLDRSPAMIVAVLAVMKAGGAYVPLDPDYPVERLAHMLSDSGARILLTQKSLLGQFAIFGAQCWQPEDGDRKRGKRILCLDSDRCDLARQSTANPELQVSPEQLAYVIYTSGSTGKPKGVALMHRGLGNLARVFIRTFVVGPGSQVLQFASFSFDASVAELVMTLCSGATLHLPNDEQRMPGLPLQRFMAAAGITHATLPPSGLAAFPQGALPKLTHLLVAGEACPPVLAAFWSKGRRFFNCYGPTEATVCATIAELACSDIDASRPLPIGRPIANFQVYVLDARRQLSPIGVPGELHIGGIGLARGYLNRTELTAEKFIPDPFSSDHGARLYRTGDLVRYRPDGNLEFLGRLDHQVKIRGVRIELGEIEAALVTHPSIREAAVLTRIDGGGERCLVGYLVATLSGESTGDGSRQVLPEIGELRNFLKITLPDYMLPAAFVWLPALPVTPNGKLDRKALPEPEAVSSSRYLDSPRDALEAILVGLWSAVLGRKTVGLHDNFFELGGHSLRATQLSSLLHEALDIAVPVRWLFESPTVSELAPRLRALLESGQPVESLAAVPANRILPGTAQITPDLLPLVALSQSDIDKIVRSVEGGAGNVQDIYPLAPLQEGILFHHQVQNSGDAYISHALLAFESRERGDAFVEAFQAVINRHDILRSAVFWEALPEPVQVVWRKAPMLVEALSFDPDKGPIAEQLLEHFDRRPAKLDLTRAPLLQILRTQDCGRCLLLIISHHLVLDHAAMDVVLSEILAHMKGEIESLPRPVPFRDFVIEARASSAQEDHESFFRSMLGDIEVPTAPFGLLDVRGDGTSIREARLELPQSLAQRLREQTNRQGATPAALCHLAWALVLSRLCDQDDVVFGTVLFGRMQGRAGIEKAVGLFINTLPIRISCDTRAIVEALRHTQQRLLALMNHEHASLNLAQRCSSVPAPAPLFSSLLNYRHGQGKSIAHPALLGAQVLLAEERSNYPFDLSIDDNGEGFDLTAQVDATVDPNRVCSFMQQALEVLVTALENGSQALLRDLDILPPAEKQQLQIQSGGNVEAGEKSSCVHHLFEIQAQRTPEAVALISDDGALSYAELNAHANQLAHALIELGVTPDARIAIALERSPSMIIALLATLKAGGAAVPLDPGYPAERLSFMLEDSGAEILITESRQRTLLSQKAAPVLCLDTDWVCIRRQPASNPLRAILPQQLAYVIYTSGSTGRPKGVAVENRSIAQHCQAVRHCCELTPQDRVFQFASFSFDTALEQILPTLCAGASLVLPASGLLSLEVVDQYLWKHGVTVLDLPPAFFRLWSEYCGARLSPQLRLIVLGGDVLSPEALGTRSQWPKPWPRILNAYGPTEATITTTYYEVPECLEGNSVPIGRPLPQRGILLLDRHGRLTPAGVAGELHIGGAGLARGYLNRPELNAEKFIPDPFSDSPDARLYKTGDLARYRTDGNLEFLGRLDHQVKIRGFRIELGEIEAALVSYAKVQEAVVISCRLADGDLGLVAYLVASGEAALRDDPENAAFRSEGALRGHLSSRLPDYMLPAVFVWLPAMPLMPNGKPDRKALLEIDTGSRNVRCLAAPRDDLEEIVQGLWSSVLKKSEVGLQDNFFELGGHSLLATQLASRLRASLGIPVPVRWFFEAPTVAELAKRLRVSLSGEPSAEKSIAIPANRILPDSPRITPELLPLVSLSQEEIDRLVQKVEGGVGNVQDIYPLTALQEGMLFHHLLQEVGDAYLSHVLLAFDSLERSEDFISALQVSVDRHDILRTAMAWEAMSEPVQIVWRKVKLPLETMHFDPSNGPIADQLVEYCHPRHYRLDLTRAPLLRLVRADDGRRSLLLLLSHHLIMDHTTLEVLIDEIRAYQHGEEPDLVATVPFRNFVAEALGRSAPDAHLSFFREMLGDVHMPTAPFGLLNVRGDGSSISEASRELPAGLALRLRHQASCLGATPAALCHLAWALVLARCCNQDDVVFGTVLFGRMQGGGGVERALGMFINTLPIRITCDERSVSEALRQTQRRLLALIGHEHVSLSLAQRCSSVPPNTPLFSSLFNYRHSPNQGDAAPQLEGVEILQGEERSNYPFDLSVDDLGSGFGLTAQVDDSVDAERICHLMQCALEILVSALEKAPQTPLCDLDILPGAENEYLDGVERQVKPDTARLAENAEHLAPCDKIDRQLVQIWEALLSARPIGIDDDFFEIGGHSLLAVRLVAEIEKSFGKRLPLSRLFEFPTIAEISTLLRQGPVTAPASCLVRIRPEGTRPPLFFVPGAGGVVSYLYPLARALDRDQPFYAFEAQGLGDASQPHASILAMAEHYVALLLEVQPQGPYFLAGHSFGGHVVYAMALLLLEKGAAIGRLAMLDSFAPSALTTAEPGRDFDDTTQILEVGQLLGKLSKQGKLITREQLENLDVEGKLAHVAQSLEEANLLPKSSGTEYLRRLHAVYKAQVQMVAPFAQNAAVPLPITIIKASEASDGQMAAIPFADDLGWSGYSSQPVSIHCVPGDHVTMMKAPQVAALAQVLGKVIA